MINHTLTRIFNNLFKIHNKNYEEHASIILKINLIFF